MKNRIVKLFMCVLLVFPPVVFSANLPDACNTSPYSNSQANLPIPDKWTATALMAPRTYEGDDPSAAGLVVARFIVDTSNSQSRMFVQFYNIKDGLGHSILYDAGEGYVINTNSTVYGSSGNENPDGDDLYPYYGTSPISAMYDEAFPVEYIAAFRADKDWTWMGDDAECVGRTNDSMYILDQENVQWWKSTDAAATQGDVANWVWFVPADSSGGTNYNYKYPLRTMLWESSTNFFPILRDYALVTFSDFDYFDEADRVLLNMSNKKIQGYQIPQEYQDYDDMLENFNTENVYSSAREFNFPWITGISSPETVVADCATYTVPKWPDTFSGEVYMTSVKYSNDDSPYRTSVLFDKTGTQSGTGEQTISTSLISSDNTFRRALHIGKQGYGVAGTLDENFNSTNTSCAKGDTLPGVPRSDYTRWTEPADCSCQAIITNNDVLSKNKTTQIINCPYTDARYGKTLFTISWNQSKEDGSGVYTSAVGPTPMNFTQAVPDPTAGTGLSVADYYSWESNANLSGDQDMFDTTGCDRTIMKSAPKNCYTCHEGTFGVYEAEVMTTLF